MSQPDRRYFAPEVVQTSGMDCGPASLKCLLEGFKIPVSYGRLREACQTDVDGTSIDTMEEIAVQLGLEAEQIMVPVDHLLLPEAQTLPAIVVIRRPDGFTHFVVVWRVHGGRLVQVMDPATGRQWLSKQQFLNAVFRHAFPVPAAGWREWAGTDDFLNPLRQRLQDLGLNAKAAQQFIDETLIDINWKSLAVLDAAARLTAAIIRADGIRRGQQAQHILSTFISQTLAAPTLAEAPIPEAYWSVWPTEPDEDGDEQLALHGAVLVRVRGQLQTEETAVSEAPPLSPELEAALAEKPERPAKVLWQLMREDGLFAPFVLFLAIILTAAGAVLEALLLRGLFEIGQSLPLASQRLVLLTAVILFSTFLLLLRFYSTKTFLGLGRQLEIRLRIAFLEKIPRLRDQYLHSRPVSDMAQRSHVIHKLRLVPEVGARFLLALFSIIFTAVGIIWLSPQNAGLVVLTAVLVTAVPLLLQPMLSERDMRMRTHIGALSRFFLDALLGLVPIRTHGAEKSVRYEHESLLVEWGQAAFSFYQGVVAMSGLQLVVGYGLAVVLLWNHIRFTDSTNGILLLVYWLLLLPLWGQELSLNVRQYPALRNTTLRLLEPLGATEDEWHEQMMAASQNQNEVSGTEISLSNVSVRAAGHMILQDLNLHIESGEHIAIVGPSGAGKSSLVGLLLGWQRPLTGELNVNGQRLDGSNLPLLRQHTAWVDPSVQLWNRSFMANLVYGSDTAVNQTLAQVIDQAELLSVLRKMPDGLQTSLGESGGLVSGGEGQRVRLGRAMLRPQVKLAILDEPFRGLARSQRHTLLQRVRRLWREATLLCITHDVSETLSFDRVLVVLNGRVVEDGNPGRLAEQPDSHFAALLQAESEVRQSIWADDQWRKIRLQNGKLVECAEGELP